jgi:hypothetical protein
MSGDTIALKFGLSSDQRVVHATVANVNGTRVGTRFRFEPVDDDLTQAFLDHILVAHKRPLRRLP